jgi:hypothetical protein
MIDKYTKAVLTVIAAALIVIVAQQAIRTARAQSSLACAGTIIDPCYVSIRQ